MQAEGEPAREVVSAEVPCLIDEQLSLWLSLESVDRTIVVLEQERRTLAAELAKTEKALNLLARPTDRDANSIVELSERVQAQGVGRDVYDQTYAEQQNSLTEIDKLLKRRRKQQALLEERVDDLIEESPRAGQPGSRAN